MGNRQISPRILRAVARTRLAPQDCQLGHEHIPDKVLKSMTWPAWSKLIPGRNCDERLERVRGPAIKAGAPLCLIRETWNIRSISSDLLKSDKPQHEIQYSACHHQISAGVYAWTNRRHSERVDGSPRHSVAGGFLQSARGGKIE